ncbi:hypothetical protein [Andreprevotia chitinilytica]|uniref:hypothetical protein n=1 Tax=Andreprevotia chitinilytica TaxID=396808 RepID=UPI000550AF33|nr:hypothetical protein [Andreprevotia chitinilytica]
MYGIIAVKLFAGPVVVGAASLAGKRWGPAVAGLLGGMPLVAACVIAAVWLEFGQAYALNVASATPVGLWGNIAYFITLGVASRWFAGKRFGWAGMLLCGWTVYLLTALALSVGGLAHNLPLGIAAPFGLLFAARFLIPKPAAPPRNVPLPRIELAARMMAAFLLILTLSTATQLLGPALTGILSPGPIIATVIPAFTLANSGRDAVLVQLRGFLTGLVGTGVSFFALPWLAAMLGAWAAVPTAAIAMGAAFGASWLMRWLGR